MLPRAPKKSAAASAQSALANLYTKRAPETILSTLCTFKIFFIVQAFLTVVSGTLTLENISWWYWGRGLTKGILHFWPLGPPGNDSIICVLKFLFCGLHLLLYILSSNAFAHFGLVKCMLVILRSRFHCKECRFWKPNDRDLTFLALRIPGKSDVENVSWWSWGAGSLQIMQVLKTSQ